MFHLRPIDFNEIPVLRAADVPEEARNQPNSGGERQLSIPVVLSFEQMKIRSGNRSLERDKKIEARPHTRKMLRQVIDFHGVVFRQEVACDRILFHRCHDSISTFLIPENSFPRSKLSP